LNRRLMHPAQAQGVEMGDLHRCDM